MQKAKRHILSTRPLPEALIAEAAAHDIVIDVVSFIETRLLLDEAMSARIRQLFQKPITAVFTSQNAVHAVAKLFQAPIPWKVYSIGNTTALAIKQLFQIAITGTADDAALLADIIIKDGVKSVSFFCGNMRRDALPETLRKANIVVEELVVYETTLVPHVITQPYDGILFFSPSAVHSFFLTNKIAAQTQMFAIGATTAGALQNYTANPVLTAVKTGKEELVQQMIRHFQSRKQEEA